MLFNSIDFAIFLPIVFVCYWFLVNKNKTLQNFLVIIASYTFYGWWDWRFLALIIISTLIDYSIGRSLFTTHNTVSRKMLLWSSLIVNLGLLGIFKYYNFFLENFITAFSFLGTEITAGTLSIVLPVGISFYTFQTLSYTIDVYKRKMKPTKDLIAFAAYVSFFPQLVAGPIERAQNLLPQFLANRQFKYVDSVKGLQQILWGLFMKVVIADNCAVYANMIFNNSAEYAGSTLLLGALFFTFQIYGDFAGYSNIAIGTARLFGFRLMQNFAFPYFSRDIAEFWRRWHISLSTWFRDYLYIPLGGSRGGTAKSVRNVFIIFVISGFWHGANWTFIAWGGLNALYFLPLLLTQSNRNHLEVVAKNKYLPTIQECGFMLMTFSLTVLAWVFFRAENISHALSYLDGIFSVSFFTIPEVLPLQVIYLVLIFMIIEWFGRKGEYAIDQITISQPKPVRWAMYYAIILAIISFAGTEQQFIYFQF